MEFCAGCGHRLGIGRFCTNCGRPIAAAAPDGDMVQRPVSASPPPASTSPPAPRYPLFSDEVHTARPTAPPPSSAPPAHPPVAPRPRPRRAGPSFLPIALIVGFLVLVAVIGGQLLFADGDDSQAEDPSPAASSAQRESAPPSPRPPRSTKGPTRAPPAEAVQDVARYATASAPSTAEPNLDTSGNMVRYEATNMVDGVPATCWRTPGDGTGLELTFTFPEPVELSEVGLINGYAKSSGALDWYAGNRKVLAATWIFDDGSEVPQSFTHTRQLQSIPVGPVTTSTVVLRLDAVSAVGTGPSARNNTAISDVSLVGAAA